MTSKAKGCQGRSAAGKACQAPPGADGYCFVHSPARGAERAAARRAGGRARHTPHSAAARPGTDIRTLDDVRALLGYVLAEALEGDNSIQRGRLLVSVALAFIQALQVGEFETRLAALEAAQQVSHERR